MIPMMPQQQTPQPSQEFELRRRIIANLLAGIIREIRKLPPQEQTYYAPLLVDAAKHLNDIRTQLIREGKLSWRLSA
jgi:hypothetical protein